MPDLTKNAQNFLDGKPMKLSGKKVLKRLPRSFLKTDIPSDATPEKKPQPEVIEQAPVAEEPAVDSGQFFRNLFAQSQQEEEERQKQEAEQANYRNLGFTSVPFVSVAKPKPVTYAPPGQGTRYALPPLDLPPLPLEQQVDNATGKLNSLASGIQERSKSILTQLKENWPEIVTGAAAGAAARLGVKGLFGYAATSLCLPAAPAIAATLAAGATAGFVSGAVKAYMRNRKREKLYKVVRQAEANGEIDSRVSKSALQKLEKLGGEHESLIKSGAKGAAFGLLGGTLTASVAWAYDYLHAPSVDVKPFVNPDKHEAIKLSASAFKPPVQDAVHTVADGNGHEVIQQTAEPTTAQPEAPVVPTPPPVMEISQLEAIQRASVEAKIAAMTASTEYRQASTAYVGSIKSFIKAARMIADDPQSSIHGMSKSLAQAQQVLNDPSLTDAQKAAYLSSPKAETILDKAAYEVEKAIHPGHIHQGGIDPEYNYINKLEAYQKSVGKLLNAHETAEKTFAAEKTYTATHPVTPPATVDHPEVKTGQPEVKTGGADPTVKSQVPPATEKLVAHNAGLTDEQKAKVVKIQAAQQERTNQTLAKLGRKPLSPG